MNGTGSALARATAVLALVSWPVNPVSAVQGIAPRDNLRAPPSLLNRSDESNTVEVYLTSAPLRTAFVPGLETDAFAYNGTIPGPTLEVREGDRVIVHFRNDLPEETTVHWHGLHLPWTTDGSPFHPVAPGEEVDFVFTVHPGTAGTYWYHPHPHHRTRKQLAMGLYGAIVVRSADDPLPSLTEKILILSDNRFGADGQVDVPDRLTPEGRVDFENGREGDVQFVNGQIMPTIRLRSGEVQRWRVINASAARVYRLAIPGHEFLHVGSDGGLFERPVAVDEVLIANSERVELLVRATGAPGSRAVLRDLPYDRYVPQTRPTDWREVREVLVLQYSDEPGLPVRALPSRLRPVERMEAASAETTRVLVLTQGFIDHRAMDLMRVDQTAELGATEVWQIENLVGMDHPFHLHGFRFQILDRNGVPEPYPSWKDTVNVPKHEVVRIITRFDDYPGKWMFHCHIVDHEEHGMMGILEVR